MQSTMMRMPLSLNHVLERAGTLFPESEIVSRLPDEMPTTPAASATMAGCAPATSAPWMPTATSESRTARKT